MHPEIVDAKVDDITISDSYKIAAKCFNRLMSDAASSSVTDWGIFGATVVGAIAALIAAGIAAWAFPSIKRKLTQTSFVVGELTELIGMGALDSKTSKKVEKGPQADPVLLLRMEVGRHDPVFDRAVFEFTRAIPSYTIAPLEAEELAERDVQGLWGLSLKMTPCRVRYVDGPDAGEISVESTRERPNFPSLTEHRLISENDAVCDWVIGAPNPTHYLSFELSDPPRIVIDIFRSHSSA